MSREDVEVIRRTIERLDQGELAPECYDAEIERVTMPDSPLRMSYTGLTGLQPSLESVQEAWERMSVEAREFIDSDEVIVAVLRLHGTKQEALDAVGLAE